MQITEVTDVSLVYDFCNRFFEINIPADGSLSQMDYSQSYGFFEKVFKKFQRETARQNFVSFPIEYEVMPTAGGGNIIFLSDDGETLSHVRIQVHVGGISGEEMTASRDSVIAKLVNVTTHEIGHAKQFDGRDAAKMLATKRTDDPFLSYISKAFETEMQALTSVLDLKQIAKETGLSVREFLKMASTDIDRFISYIGDRSELIGLTNIFIKLRNYPESPVKTTTYRKLLKTMYHYAEVFG